MEEIVLEEALDLSSDRILNDDDFKLDISSLHYLNTLCGASASRAVLRLHISHLSKKTLFAMDMLNKYL